MLNNIVFPVGAGLACTTKPWRSGAPARWIGEAAGLAGSAGSRTTTPRLRGASEGSPYGDEFVGVCSLDWWGGRSCRFGGQPHHYAKASWRKRGLPLRGMNLWGFVRWIGGVAGLAGLAGSRTTTPRLRGASEGCPCGE
jgi:hypothetical protein